MSSGGITTSAVAMVFLALAVAAPIWANIERARQATRTEALHREGLATTGRVTRLWSSGRSRRPMVNYAFTVDGAAYAGGCSVPSAIRAELRQDGRLTIRYVASNPAINHPAAWEAPVLGSGGFLVAIMFAPTGILLLIQVRRQRPLVAEGLPTAGVVTKSDRGGKSGPRVNYQFRTSDGSLANGTSNSNAAAGAAICVLYLPQQPQRNLAYPGCYCRVTQ